MAKQLDPNGELRSAHLMREFKAARHSVPEGGIGVFMRVALAVIFMYLIVFSNLALGITGPVLVSVLFLSALLVPLIYQAVQVLMERQRSKQVETTAVEDLEVRQEG